MKKISAVIVPSAALVLCLMMAPPAGASGIRECGRGLGASHTNLTTRNVSCAAARVVVRRMFRDIRPCWPSERRMGSCAFRRGQWSVRGRWFRDRYGAHQLDLRATASAGRVVRAQSAWDGE
jgi:hypothetical protein